MSTPIVTVGADPLAVMAMLTSAAAADVVVSPSRRRSGNWLIKESSLSLVWAFVPTSAQFIEVSTVCTLTSLFLTASWVHSSLMFPEPTRLQIALATLLSL
jgi:hypothetical protein